MGDTWGILHRRGSDLPLQEEGESLLWKTCLRQILFVPQVKAFSLSSQDEVFEGDRAYQFLLEVVCGLHSPMLGETEVFGQFKDFLQNVDWDGKAALSLQKDIFHRVLSDAKSVRTEFLTHLGSQSYGSLARRWLADVQEVHILGAGRLAQDIMPWLLKAGQKICLHVRSPEKYISLQGPSVTLCPYPNSISLRGGVIICAPESSENITEWIANTEVRRVLDLRGESRQDPLRGPWKIQDLRAAFAAIEGNKDKIEGRIQKARSKIKGLAHELSQGQKLRPFGWDDLCA